MMTEARLDFGNVTVRGFETSISSIRLLILMSRKPCVLIPTGGGLEVRRFWLWFLRHADPMK